MLGILIPEFPSQTHAFFWREIQALREMGQEVALISTKRPELSACRHTFGHDAHRETEYLFPPRFRSSVTLGLRPKHLARAIGYIGSLKQSTLRQRAASSGLIICAEALRRHAELKRIVHIHAHSCANSAHIVAICKIMGGPSYSLTLHGDLEVYGVDHASKMGHSSFVATAGAHLVGPVIEKTGLAPERVQSIWMGLDTNVFCDAGRRRPVSGRLHLATIARLNRAKGHLHALAAVRLALDHGLEIRYTIAGDGPYQAEILAEIKRLRLDNEVELVGSLGESEVLDLLQHADVFVLSSIGAGEAAPVSVMEAMSCGMPVVCSIIGSTPHMIAHEVDGLLVAQQDELGLSSAFIRLAEDIGLRSRLGSAARARAVASFDSRISAARLLKAVRTHAPQ